MRKIGIFGGTFNPVHKGHIQLAEGARALFGLDAVYFIPTGESYHKEVPYMPSREDRLKLLELALEGHPEFKVSTVDLDRPGPTYTVDTVEDLRAFEPEAELYLLLGSDAFLDIMSWRDVDDLCRNLRFLVALRKGVGKLVVDSYLHDAPDYLKDRTLLFDWPIASISSEEIKRGGFKKKHFPGKVYEYIKEKGLYPDDLR